MKLYSIKTAIMLSVILLSLTSFAHAEDGMVKDHSNHQITMDKVPANAPQSIYNDAMNKMHKDMMVKPTGDADIDFVKGMIPHHQGAIDMAKIVLKNGKDPAIRKLARGVIRAQESEIKMMHSWLKTHNAK